MKNIKKHIALYPFSLLYGLVVGFRNYMFDSGVLKSKAFTLPIISVGNLSAGGTGKTPHAEFILSILQNEWKTAVLSRGYKRKTKGFYLADEQSDNLILGDEPFQIHRKFPKVAVAVDEKRVHGVTKLLELVPKLQAVVLDDAFQHRYIRPGFSILLTDYAHLFTRDSLLPMGRLREGKKGSQRANIIVVTKCPADLKAIDMRLIEKELTPNTNQQLFFSTYVYDQIMPVFPDFQSDRLSYNRMKIEKINVLLVAGIVSPQPIVEYLEQYSPKISSMFFADHYAFNAKDFAAISKEFDEFSSSPKILLVTEKDAARLVSNPLYPESLKAWTYALPIRVTILQNQENLFITKIKSYVAENSRNR